MSTKTLKDLFVDELQDMYDAEHRIVLALPKMMHAATCPDLKAALEHHWEETKGHITRIEQAFVSIGKTAKAKKCEATIGLLKEADEILSEFKGSPAINAALIAAGQKVEHYEIASYGCLHEWAGLLDHPEAAGLLEETLNEEKAANNKLTELARAGENKDACSTDSGKAGNPPTKPAPAPTTPPPTKAKESPVKAATPSAKTGETPNKGKSLPPKTQAAPGKSKVLSSKAKALRGKSRNRG